MIRSALVVILALVGFVWVTGGPYSEDDAWRVVVGWIFIAWAVFNIPAFVRGAKGWAKLFLAVLIVALGMALYNGNWALLEALF